MVPSDSGAKENRYRQIISKVFFDNYTEGASEVPFTRPELIRAAEDLGLKAVGNYGDILASFRFRTELPDSIRERAPTGLVWVIRLAGKGRYKFAAVVTDKIIPDPLLVEIKVPDATPGIIATNALSDEQALLARVRYNRLLDIFTGVTCYSLQSHLRATVEELGKSQVETDELYVGIDKNGAHYSFPVQAKGTSDKLSIVQLEQDFFLCTEKFPRLICRPVAAQFMNDELVAMFDFQMTPKGLAMANQRHYRLVPSIEMTDEDLASYRRESERRNELR